MFYFADIEAQIRDIQAKKKEVSDNNGNDKGVGLGESGYFDSDIYDGGGNKKYEGYVTSIAANDEADDDDEDVVSYSQKRSGGFNVNVALLNDVAQVSFQSLIFI